MNFQQTTKLERQKLRVLVRSNRYRGLINTLKYGLQLASTNKSELKLLKCLQMEIQILANHLNSQVD
jgi:hypothetical protein